MAHKSVKCISNFGQDLFYLNFHIEHQINFKLNYRFYLESDTAKMMIYSLVFLID